MLAGKRSARVGEQLLREIAELLEHRVKDPRVKGVTLTGVDMSPDLKFARVFFSVHGEGCDLNDVMDGFSSAKGFIKKEIAARMELRYVPDVDFRHDTSLERGEKMERLLDSLVHEGPDDEGSCS